MLNAIEHFSRTRVENTMLQVMADKQLDLARLIGEEESVIRHYARLGTWPHKSVNIFVLEDLKPLVAQIKSAAVLSTVVAEDIERRPMVNIYDAADLTECTIFVNRGELERDGAWRDQRSLRALLAHEHGHPLAENETVHAARELSIEVSEDGQADQAAAVRILHLLADRLCLHAPQEVFANEIAIAAGFEDALFHLDKDAVEKACVGVRARPSLVKGLDKQVAQGKLNADQAAALLLIGDLQAHLGFALETAPFLRTGHRREAEALEALLTAGVWKYLDPAALPLYEAFRDHYCRLRTDLGPSEMKAWAEDAAALLAAFLRERKLGVRFDVVRARSTSRKRNAREGRPIPGGDNPLHGGGSP